jgi:hypothetical protein
VVDDRDVLGGKALVDEFFGHLLTGHPVRSLGLERRREQVEEAETAWAAASAVRQHRQDNQFPEPDPIVDPPEGPHSYSELHDLGYEGIREIKENFVLLANVEHDFSSLPIAEEPGLTHKLLQLIDPPTPGMVKDKRDEIERAREYLEKQLDPMEMEVGPLLPTMVRGLDGADDSGPDPKTEKKKTEKKAKESPAGKNPQSKRPPIVPIRRPTTGAAQAHGGSSANVQLPTEATMAAQDSQTSIPESVLAASLSSSRYGNPRSGNLTRGRLEVLNILQRREMSATQHRHARIEAYLAATEDSYSAWAGRITSAGDNHGEEEMEL